MKYGEVRRGSIGQLSIERLTDQLAEDYGAPSTNGALISRMFRNSEAYQNGLRVQSSATPSGSCSTAAPGDDPSQFVRNVADAKIGSTATVKVLRNGRSIEFKLPIVSSLNRRAER